MDERTIARFWPKVERRGEDDCWPWLAGKNNGHYGTFRNPGNTVAHRIAYELLIGPIPEGLTLDHTCRNRACVNPAHLEPVTHRVNILRGNGACARFARRTHCQRGHLFDVANTGRRAGGYRVCLTCNRQRNRLAYWAAKERAA